MLVVRSLTCLKLTGEQCAHPQPHHWVLIPILSSKSPLAENKGWRGHAGGGAGQMKPWCSGEIQSGTGSDHRTLPAKSVTSFTLISSRPARSNQIKHFLECMYRWPTVFLYVLYVPSIKNKIQKKTGSPGQKALWNRILKGERVHVQGWRAGDRRSRRLDLDTHTHTYRWRQVRTNKQRQRWW